MLSLFTLYSVICCDFEAVVLANINNIVKGHTLKILFIYTQIETVCESNFKTTVYFYFVNNTKYIKNIKQDQDWLYNLSYTISIRTNFVFNYVTNIRRCNCGTSLLYFIAHALELFPCFSTRYRWNLLVLYGFLLCPTVLWMFVIMKWRPSRSDEHLHISNRHLQTTMNS